MIRKTTAAALVLSAVPAALALTLFSGTAQADDDTPWGRSVPSGAVITEDDTPWGHGFTASDDDTPWGRAITLPALPNDDDTPWG
jgi:hypothetical protein